MYFYIETIKHNHFSEKSPVNVMKGIRKDSVELNKNIHLFLCFAEKVCLKNI